MVRDLPEKLRLTFLVLNCRTQKELIAQLIKLNPNTTYSPEKAYKWMKGVSRPRDAQIYADLSALLGLEGGAVFFQTSSFEAFSEAVMGGAQGAAPLGLGAASSPTASQTYACFSPAWSVTKAGEIVIGRLEISAVGDRVQTTYSDTHAGKTYPYTGHLTRQSTTLFGMLTSPSEDLSIYLSLNTPSRAGLFLGGVFSGAALNDPFTRPCACRIGCLLIEGARETAPTGYEAGASGVAEALHAFGITEAPSLPLTTAVTEAITSPPEAGLIDISLDDAIRIETLLFQVQERSPE